jgi:hypothetical protein
VIIAEQELYRLLLKGIPSVTDEPLEVIPELDYTTFERLPALIFGVAGGSQVSNSEPPVAWEYTLSLTVVDTDMDRAQRHAAAIYKLVHAWNEPAYGADALNITDAAYASDVSDVSVFVRPQTYELPEKRIVSLDATFSVQLGHNA